MCLSKTKYLFVSHAKYVAVLLAVFTVYILTGIGGCPIYKYLGVRCPTCGVTRALGGLLSGDLEQYFSMNPFAIPLVIAVVVGIHLSAIPVKWRKRGILYIVITTVSNYCWYLYSLV